MPKISGRPLSSGFRVCPSRAFLPTQSPFSTWLGTLLSLPPAWELVSDLLESSRFPAKVQYYFHQKPRSQVSGSQGQADWKCSISMRFLDLGLLTTAFSPGWPSPRSPLTVQHETTPPWPFLHGQPLAAPLAIALGSSA